MAPTMVTAEFGSASAAEGARRHLVDFGIAESRIELVAAPQTDAIAGEYPGQPYANQPGQPAEAPGDAARSHPTCRLTVMADSPDQAGRLGAILEKRGARVSRSG
ncbi:MAG: hypothetical protein ACT4P4_29885 [Betaproteobacteria bacterium]